MTETFVISCNEATTVLLLSHILVNLLLRAAFCVARFGLRKRLLCLLQHQCVSLCILRFVVHQLLQFRTRLSQDSVHKPHVLGQVLVNKLVSWSLAAYAICLFVCFRSLASPKGGWRRLMSPPCVESQGCHLIPHYCLMSCSSAQSYCSLYHVFFSLLLNGPFPRLFPPENSSVFFVEIKAFYTEITLSVCQSVCPYVVLSVSPIVSAHYLLNCSTINFFFYQTWYCGVLSRIDMSCGKIGLLSSL